MPIPPKLERAPPRSQAPLEMTTRSPETHSTSRGSKEAGCRRCRGSRGDPSATGSTTAGRLSSRGLTDALQISTSTMGFVETGEFAEAEGFDAGPTWG
eukprot:6313355-Pyramimonas_sp.AAC.1